MAVYIVIAYSYRQRGGNYMCVWLVSRYAHVFILLSLVIVTLPNAYIMRCFLCKTQTVLLKISAIVVLPGDRGSASIGHVTIGPGLSGTERAHWTQAMASLRRPVTMWHRLH